MSLTTNLKYIKAAILTVSDRCSEGSAEDKSGPILKKKLECSNDINCKVVEQACCIDSVKEIETILQKWCDLKIDLIITTGGTGLAKRDVTPEAVRKLLVKEATGISLLMVSESLKITPLASLSRPVCGVIGQESSTLVITLPGSSKAASECFEIVSPVLKHAIDLLKNSRDEIESTHESIQLPKMCSVVDVSNIANRDRKSSYAMIDVHKAVDIVLSKAFLMSVQSVILRKSAGFAVALPVFAKENLPPFPASIKDGYAVITSDAAGDREVMGESYAGINPNLKKLSIGSCIRINTGAPIPQNADAVVQVEDTILLKATENGKDEILIKILKAPTINQDIRKIGSDIKKGQLLYNPNTVLGPSEIGVLASAGISTIEVYEKPKVAILSTGNELQPVNEKLKTGFIYDSNKEMLVTLLEENSFSVIDAGIASDDPTSLMLSIQNAFEKCHVLVTSGSVSMGEKDILRPVLINDFHAVIHFAQVFMKPGKPTTFATCIYKDQPKLILGLPGNPASAMVTSYLYLLPLLRKMSGFIKYSNAVIKVQLGCDIKLDSRPEYHRVQLIWSLDEQLPVAHSTGNQISSQLLSFSSASALLQLPPATDSVKILCKGASVDAIILSI